MKALRIFSIAALVLTAFSAQAQSSWNAEPTVSDSALIFQDDLDFYMNSYSKKELRAMRKRVNILKMSTSRSMNKRIKEIRAFSEGRSNNGARIDFRLPTASGSEMRVDGGNGKVRAFMFVSLTNPPALFQLPLWDSLAMHYDSSKVQLFVVYSKELHPGERSFKKIKKPQSESEKMELAKRFAEKTIMPVAVDGLNNEVFDQYGKAPNSAFVFDQNGTQVFRGTWADSRKIAKVVDILLEWGQDSDNIR